MSSPIPLNRGGGIVLVTALSEGTALPLAMRFAGTAAALACIRPGAQPSMPTRAEIEAALSPTLG